MVKRADGQLRGYSGGTEDGRDGERLVSPSCSCSTVAEAKAKAEVEAEACTSIGGRDSCRRSHVTAEASSAQASHSSSNTTPISGALALCCTVSKTDTEN